VFESLKLRKDFWCKQGKVRGEWSNLHNEEFHDFYTHQIFFGRSKPEELNDWGM
jgi:hypothetical protein